MLAYFILKQFENDPDDRPLKELRPALPKDASAVLAPRFQMPAG